MSIDPDAVGRAVPFTLDSGGARLRGIRDERVEPATIARAVAAHGMDVAPLPGSPAAADATILKRDPRSRVTAVSIAGLPVVVKEVRKGGVRRLLADRVRGAPATRAFRAGRALIGRGIGAALPYAVVEQRVGGLTVRSLLVSADLRDVPTAAALLGEGPGPRSRALAALEALLVALHRAGVVHGDLRAQHVHVDESVGAGTPPRTRLIDLEGVRFRRRLGDDRRIEDLSQLNASVPDDHASAAERRALFARYAQALPFRESSERVMARILRESRARNHLFEGRDCGPEGGRATTA